MERDREGGGRSSERERERLCRGGGELLRAWLLRACLRAAVGRRLVWVRGRRRSCAAVSPGEVFLQLNKFAPATI